MIHIDKMYYYRERIVRLPEDPGCIKLQKGQADVYGKEIRKQWNGVPSTNSIMTCRK